MRPKKRYNIAVYSTSINVNTSYEGETIEEKIERIINNKEPISDASPLLYTERKEGVRPEFDIRTDRFDIAIDKMDYSSRMNTSKRLEKFKSSESESTQATGDEVA